MSDTVAHGDHTPAVCPCGPEFATHCADLIGAVGAAVQTKRMFGGFGVYVDDVFIDVITGENLYLKTRRRDPAALLGRWRKAVLLTARGALQSTHFCSAPQDAMEFPALMRPWAQLALEAALRARPAKEAALTEQPSAAFGMFRFKGLL